MNFSMVRRAEPPHLQRLRVIVMVRVRTDTTHLTRTAYKRARSERIAHNLPSPPTLWPLRYIPALPLVHLVGVTAVTLARCLSHLLAVASLRVALNRAHPGRTTAAAFALLL
jgi:hypothetical protein